MWSADSQRSRTRGVKQGLQHKEDDGQLERFDRVLAIQ